MNALQSVALHEQQLFAEADEKYAVVKAYLLAAESQGMAHGEVEEWLEREGRELLRLVYQSHLNERASREPTEAVVGADGTPRNHKRVETRRLMTVFGPVEVRRRGYSARSKPSVYPLDAELNLPTTLHSAGVRRRLCQDAAKGSFDEAVATLSDTTGAIAAKRQALAIAEHGAADFDAFYEHRLHEPLMGDPMVRPRPELIVLTTDAKGVVMRQEDLRDATRAKAETQTHKLAKRLCAGEKRQAKRMAQVASVYELELFPREVDIATQELLPLNPLRAVRPRPVRKRVWASLRREADDVVADMVAEAIKRDPQRQRPWVGLVDGNMSQLKSLLAHTKTAGIKLTVVIDIIHVLEYVWEAGHALHGAGNKVTEQWVQKRLAELLRGRVSTVASGIRRSATLWGLTGKERKAVDTCVNYLLKYKRYMRYNQYLRDGLPIGTGVIEGACRYLVKDRMDITGARWSLDGAEAVLKLRALRASGDFEAYWAFHQVEELNRNHRARFMHQHVPTLAPAAKKCHLRVVK